MCISIVFGGIDFFGEAFVGFEEGGWRKFPSSEFCFEMIEFMLSMGKNISCKKIVKCI